MIAYSIRRLYTTIIAFFFLSYAIWFLTTPDGIRAVEQLGPIALLPTRYLTWLFQIIHGDLGYSVAGRASVLAAFQSRALVTMLLVVPAFLLQEIIAIPLGVMSAARFHTQFDNIVSNAVFIFASMPVFWLALMGIMIFSVWLQITPVIDIVDLRTTGAIFGSPDYWQYFHANTLQAIGDIIHHLMLPVLVMVITNTAADSQLLRASMLEILSQEYIRAARARGISERRVIWHHALRNALFPLITSIGMQAPRLVFTASIIEFTFAIPGLGELFVQSVFTPPGRTDFAAPVDTTTVTAFFLILGAVALLWNILTDIAYIIADPRLGNSGNRQNEVYRPGEQKGLSRRVFTIGQFSFSIMNILVALLMVSVGTIAIIVTRNTNAQQGFTRVSGVWVGNITGNTIIPEPFAMRLLVDKNGAITGNGIACTLSGPIAYAASGSTDGIGSVHITFLSSNTALDSMAVQGILPNSSFTLAGTGIILGTQHTVQIQAQHGTEQQLLIPCKVSQ